MNRNVLADWFRRQAADGYVLSTGEYEKWADRLMPLIEDQQRAAQVEVLRELEKGFADWATAIRYADGRDAMLDASYHVALVADEIENGNTIENDNMINKRQRMNRDELADWLWNNPHGALMWQIGAKRVGPNREEAAALADALLPLIEQERRDAQVEVLRKWAKRLDEDGCDQAWCSGGDPEGHGQGVGFERAAVRLSNAADHIEQRADEIEREGAPND